MKKKNSYFVYFVILPIIICILIVTSYFAIGRIFAGVVFSDFQKISLHIFSAVALAFLLSPMIWVKQRKKDEAIFQNLDPSEQRKIRKKDIIIFLSVLFIAISFANIVYRNIDWSPSQQSVAHISTSVGFFAVLVYPFFITRMIKLKNSKNI
jgi:amino acid transporter